MPSVSPAPLPLIVVDTPATARAAAAVLLRSDAVGLDVECDTANPKQPNQMRDTLVGVGFSGVGATVYGLWDYEPYRDVLLEHLTGKRWYAHNAMYDGTVLRRHGLRLGELAGDGRIIAYLLGEPEAGLKPLLSQRYGVETLEFHELLEDHGAVKISEVPLAAQAEYCGSQDAELCVPLARDMEAELDERVGTVYREIELPMVNILMDMTAQGIRFDRAAATPLLERATAAKEGLDDVIRVVVREAGFSEVRMQKGHVYRPRCAVCKGGSKKRIDCVACAGSGKGAPVDVVFNPGSWQQLQRFLYDHLRLPVRRWAGKKKPWELTEEDSGATDSLALLQLRERHSSIPLILSRRKYAKEEGFLTSWLKFSEADGKLHTTFKNTTVVSGRLSASDPNLMQVQLKHRVLYLPDPGCVLIDPDYSQLEIRIMAYMSQDPVMLKILQDGENFHRRTASFIYGREPDLVTDAMYKQSKIGNFLTAYGGEINTFLEGVEKMVLESAEDMPLMTRAEARDWLSNHRKVYKRYWQWVQWTVMRARQLGYSTTAFGRPRFLPDLLSPSDEYRMKAERQAVNHAIQGTAADLIKMAMRAIAGDAWMRAAGQMLLQVHDEIVAQAIFSKAVQYAEYLKRYMECGQPFLPSVELVVDVNSGANWRDVHK